MLVDTVQGRLPSHPVAEVLLLVPQPEMNPATRAMAAPNAMSAFFMNSGPP